ncbi:MAG TPA: transglutaminase family protein [Nitrospiria bacterium]|nr:transglutaminase family protein [Nitrospiria bacterium]HUK55639.1 transglutaminase family protein [Nitrospiria bacterium]
MIRHQTIYRYSAPLTRSIQLLRLIPHSDRRQRVQEWRLSLPADAPEYFDAYGNVTRLLIMEGRHDEIKIGVEGLVETSGNVTFPSAVDQRFPPEIFLTETPLTAVDEPLRNFADQHRNEIGSNPFAALQTLMERIRSRVRYVKGTTHVQTTAADVLSQGSGVCQDHSHLFIACCRALGVPARYVSGYVYSDPDHHPEVAMHAWAEAWVDGMGWLSFDVSNGRPAGEMHLRLAIGRDYLDACPVRGVRFGGGDERMEVRVHVATAQQ